MGIISLVLALIWWDLTGVLIGVALLSLGGIELQGRRFLLAVNPTATRWLVSSQFGLLLVILSYCLRSLAHPPTLPALPGEITSLMENLPSYGGNPADTLQPLLRITYALLAFVSIIYQGGMALYYLRKVPLAMQTPPPLPNVAS